MNGQLEGKIKIGNIWPMSRKLCMAVGGVLHIAIWHLRVALWHLRIVLWRLRVATYH